MHVLRQEIINQIGGYNLKAIDSQILLLVAFQSVLWSILGYISLELPHNNQPFGLFAFAGL